MVIDMGVPRYVPLTEKPYQFLALVFGMVAQQLPEDTKVKKLGICQFKLITMNHKISANRGVERNKKPLQNKIYWITVHNTELNSDYDIYKFKDLGYLILEWQYEKDYHKSQVKYTHGFITPELLKNKLGEKQWSKFCDGKREFIIQRRINGNNIKKI